ncbi:hypothetical protein [Photobacterium kishitanii]|uniref:Uncharacterized protein n=1 Tax=Photobacterium kishitanii TaxID=318456 RepID=A0A2T3KLZ1_9GAMM|nr:hypothetical protein [Photobacterium kishitanii]PSV00660.1 hypothetical protein C9J27_05845 [Photobacterium kishitanii]
MIKRNRALKSCPFCGSEAKLFTDVCGGLWFAFCPCCAKRTFDCNYKSGAIRLWNNQKVVVALESRVQELESVLLQLSKVADDICGGLRTQLVNHQAGFRELLEDDSYDELFKCLTMLNCLTSGFVCNNLNVSNDIASVLAGFENVKRNSLTLSPADEKFSPVKVVL